MGRIYRLERTQQIQRPLDAVFSFFADATNLEAITPRFLRFRILSPTPVEMRAGARIDYAMSLFGMPVRWRTRITEWEPGVRFVDEQEAGPYAVWRHTHEFEPQGEATLVRDVVDYAVPLGPLGALAQLLFVRRTLGRIFDFRRDVTGRLLDDGSSAPPAGALASAASCSERRRRGHGRP